MFGYATDSSGRRIDPASGPWPGSEQVVVDGGGNPALQEWADAGLDAPDIDAIRQWRVARLQAELTRRDLAGIVLLDPINIRYATDCTNMQIFCMHNMVRYAWVGADGRVVLFDFPRCEHLASGLDLVDEVRPAVPLSYFDAGDRQGEFLRHWSREVATLARHAGGDARIAVDRTPPAGEQALAAHGLEVVAGYEPCEHARSVKHPEEIKAMRRSIHAAETGLWQMWRALEPGRTTENELWSWLHQANIARGGEWIETRLLASGPRTNPWFQECSDRVIQHGDLVSFDTDLVGPYGYCADVSRAWVAGAEPTARQRELHDLALEHVNENARLLRPGATFREICEQSHRLPPDCRANRYACLVHGIGLCDEYPAVRYPEDWGSGGYDGVLESGMTVCVEAYVGPDRDREGVKLERQALVTDGGLEFLDSFPLGLVPNI